MSDNELLTPNGKPNYYAWIFTTVVLSSLVLWLFSIFYNGVYATQFDIFFRRCADIFADFTNWACIPADLNPYHGTIYGAAAHAQTPLLYTTGYVLSRIIINPQKYYYLAYMQPQYLIMLVILTAIVITAMNSFISVHLNGSTMLKFFCALAIIFSGPMLFLIERGNPLLLSIFACIVYCFWYDSMDKIKREIALVCLGFAFALKLSPCVFGILLLVDKEYKEAFRAAVYGLILLIVPVFFLEGGLTNLPLMISNMQVHLADRGDLVGVTLRSIIYGIFCLSDLPFSVGIQEITQPVYREGVDMLINIIRILSAVLLFLASFRFTKKWHTILAVSLIVVVIPQVSGFYTAPYLIPSLILFLNEKARAKEDAICLFAYTLLCCVYFIGIQINYHFPVFILYLFMLWQSVRCWAEFFKSKYGNKCCR